MTENDRIKYLRKELNLTLVEFSSKLGITHAALSNIENGKRNVTEQLRKSICREFRVDPIWLATGEGEPTIDQSVELIEMLDKLLHNESKLAKTMFKMFAQYTLEDWKDLERIVNKSAEYIKMLESKDESDENMI
ncbi:MAG: helix-turn-helix domain-containing protein [Lachnospiraceae bacterium]